MKLTITINMDGAAFEDNMNSELLYILTEQVIIDMSAKSLDRPLYDTNGNKCGELVVTENEEN